MQFLHSFSFVIKPGKQFLFLFFMVFTLNLHSQVADSAYIESLFNKSWQYLYSNPDSASWFLEKGKSESENAKYFRGIVKYYNFDAALRISLDQNQKAVQQYDQAIAVATK